MVLPVFWREPLRHSPGRGKQAQSARIAAQAYRTLGLDRSSKSPPYPSTEPHITAPSLALTGIEPRGLADACAAPIPLFRESSSIFPHPTVG